MYPEQIQQYLQYLNHSNFTLVSINDKKTHVHFVTANEVFDVVQEHQNADWYVMINEGDGKNYNGNKTCRAQVSVTHFTELFIDSDEAPKKLIDDWLDYIQLKPHLIVESSKDRYHYYFKIEKELKVKHISHNWKTLNKFINSLGLTDVEKIKETGIDYNISSDFSRILRLPGSLHTKKGSYVKIHTQNFHAPYDLRELFIKYKDKLEIVQQELDHKPFALPEGTVTKNNRHATALSQANKFASQGYKPSEILMFLDGIIQAKFEEPHLFAKNGERRQELLDIVQDAYNNIEKSKRLELEQQLLQSDKTAEEVLLDLNFQLEADEVINGAKGNEATKAKTDLSVTDIVAQYALPNSFYFNAPEPIGSIVRFICENAMYPIPAITFASTVAMIGSLKAPYIRSDQGHAPGLYLLCMADSGAGKNEPNRILQNSLRLVDNKAFDMLVNDVRSHLGLVTHMQENNSCGLIWIDESTSLLEGFSDKKAESYIKKEKETFLKIYTSHGFSSVKFGGTGDKKIEKIELNYPVLNLVGYSTFGAIDNYFTADLLQDGLIQRFLLIPHATKYRQANPHYKAIDTLPAHLIADLRSILTDSRLHLLDHQKDIDSLVAQINEIESEEIDGELVPKDRKSMSKDDKAKLKSLQARLEQLEHTVIPPRKIPFMTEAYSYYQSLQAKYDGLYNEEVDKKINITKDLYTRNLEMVGRLALIMTSGESITLESVKYAEQVIDNAITIEKALLMRGDGGSLVKSLSNNNKLDLVRKRLVMKAVELKRYTAVRTSKDKFVDKPYLTAMEFINCVGSRVASRERAEIAQQLVDAGYLSIRKDTVKGRSRVLYIVFEEPENPNYLPAQV